MKRTFMLGEEWLYYKVYCGARTSDSILQDLFLPMSQEMIDNLLIDQWYFLRYNDPDPHLRIRFRLVEIKALSSVIAKFKDTIYPYLNENLVWKVETGTYTRELERYGENSMELCENIFYRDSELLTNAISMVEDEELYFLFILKCIDSFLNLFRLNVSEKHKFYENHSVAFKREFKIGKVTRTSLAKKYNGISKKLEEFLAVELPSDYFALQELLNKRNSVIKNSVFEISRLKKEGVLEVDLNDLLGSLIHMFVNRAFRDRQRFFEMLAYDFLERQLKINSYIRN